MLLEVGNVIWKKHRRGEISIEEGRQALSILRASPVRIESSNSQLEEAWEIAVALDRSVYDGVYVALAVASDARLVTADRRLRNAMAAGPLRDRVIGLQDL
jgi:predicted nucleic acid-binding protein